MFDSRIYNFSAGPSALPRDVLETAAAEMMNCGGSGLSVMEMSHRSSAFQRILDDAESDLRDLMGISDRYSVLFLQGGGTLQFAMVPANLMRKSFKADYVLTGMWAKSGGSPPSTEMSALRPSEPSVLLKSLPSDRTTSVPTATMYM